MSSRLSPKEQMLLVSPHPGPWTPGRNLCGILVPGEDREAPRETCCVFEPGNSGTDPKYQPQGLGLVFQLLTKGVLDVSLWWGLISEEQSRSRSWSGWMPREGFTVRWMKRISSTWETCPRTGLRVHAVSGAVPAGATSAAPVIACRGTYRGGGSKAKPVLWVRTESSCRREKRRLKLRSRCPLWTRQSL